jgi:tyrosine-protein kinase Etk/Wzc
MNSEFENIPKQNEENNSVDKFDGLFLIALLLKYKFLIIIFVILSTVVAGFIAFNMPNWYSSTASLVPPKSSESGVEGLVGNISSALKEFGMTKLGGGSSEGYSFIVILNSRTIKESLIKKFDLAKEYEIPDTMKIDIIKTFESNFEVNMEAEGNYTVTIDSKDKYKAVDMVNFYIQQVNSLAEDLFRRETRQNKQHLEERLRLIDSTLAVVSEQLHHFSKESMLFSPLDQAKAVTSAFSDLKAEEIKQEIILELIKNRYGEADPFTQEQKKLIAELKDKYQQFQTQPGFVGNFPLTDAALFATEYLGLYAKYETFIKVKSFLLPMLEQVKLDEKRNIRTLYVVDPPQPADKKSKPKRSLILAGTAFGSFLISVIVILLIHGYINFTRKYKDYIKSNKI